MAEETMTEAEAAPVDNAAGLTNGLIFCTAAFLLIAFVVMEKALAHWFGAGMFA